MISERSLVAALVFVLVGCARPTTQSSSAGSVASGSAQRGEWGTGSAAPVATEPPAVPAAHQTSARNGDLPDASATSSPRPAADAGVRAPGVPRIDGDFTLVVDHSCSWGKNEYRLMVSATGATARAEFRPKDCPGSPEVPSRTVSLLPARLEALRSLLNETGALSLGPHSANVHDGCSAQVIVLAGDARNEFRVDLGDKDAPQDRIVTAAQQLFGPAGPRGTNCAIH